MDERKTFNFQSCAARLVELDALYTQIIAVSGFSAEQLLEMFMDGYTLKAPDEPAPLTKFNNAET